MQNAQAIDAIGAFSNAWSDALLGATGLSALHHVVGHELPQRIGARQCRLVLPAASEPATAIAVTASDRAARDSASRPCVSEYDATRHVTRLELPLFGDSPSTAIGVLDVEFAGDRSGGDVDDGTRTAAALLGRRLAAVLDIEALRESVMRLQEAERLQRALYAIADLAGSEREMPDVLRSIHGVVANLMYAENFFIVLYDRSTDSMRFIYFVDVADTDIPPPRDIPLDEMRGSLTWHLLRGGQAMRGTLDEIERDLVEPLANFGPDCVDWLGVPLLRSADVVGGIVVQSYTPSARFTAADLALLTYVGQHILTALERKQAFADMERYVFERTQALFEANVDLQQQVLERQRSERLQEILFRIAELASTSDSIDDFHAAVHRIVGSLLFSGNFYIALLSEDQTELTFPYSVDEFDRSRTPRALGKGLTEYVLRSGRALLANRTDIDRLEAAGEVSTHGKLSLCWLGVPLICAERTVGVIAVQSYSDEHLYTPRDQELLTFVSYHIANALERKRNAQTLRQAYADLELRVGERTAELATANRDLRAEIGRRERIEQQLIHEAMHDGLTGLPNRARLLIGLGDALANYLLDRRRLFAVLFLDLDRFKVINDSVGHLFGDELLEEVGQRISLALRAADMVARLGGDEFAVLLVDIEGAADAEKMARQLIATLNLPIRLAGKEVFTSASIGIALAAPRYTRAEELLRDADAAMYRAKAEGRQRFALFDERMHRDAIDLLELESDLRNGVARHEFEPYFQPIVDLANARVVGYEALLRWRHPQRGVLCPGEFLGVAEESGVSEQIDWQIFALAFAAAPPLTANGGFVSINLSGRHFHSADLAQRLLDLMRAHHVAPASIWIEVTESVLLDDPAAVKNILQALRAAGVTIALDDFGTGYSSLSYLHQFPLQSLKIDRSFVAELGSGNGGGGALVRVIMAMAGSLGMRTVAEGIETEAQRDVLLQLGCRTGQGFLLARPQPALHWIGEVA